MPWRLPSLEGFDAVRDLPHAQIHASDGSNAMFQAAFNDSESPRVSKPDVHLLAVRKPLQPDNKKHIDEDDNCSTASSVATSLRMGKSGVTHGSASTFRSGQRAEKRNEYYQKLEEKNQALEAERNDLEQRQIFIRRWCSRSSRLCYTFEMGDFTYDPIVLAKSRSRGS